jgi:hypothetical protein
VEDFNKKITYDGSQFQAQYTSNNYEIIGNSILIFRGGMKLSPEEMVDLKDIQREGHLSEILISSDDSLHLIIEEFDIQPPNLEIQYYRLRILIQIIIESLEEKGITIKREGTDIYVNSSKLSVAIASVGISSSKIHFGINIGNSGFPAHVNAVGLLKLNFKENEIYEWILNLAKQYITEIYMVKEDISKTRSI